MNKVELIESYINRCEKTITTNNTNEAKKLAKEIIVVFENEIDGIQNGLDRSSVAVFYGSREIDYIGDLILLKWKLVNYKINVESENEKMKYELELAKLKQPQISANAEASSTQTTSVTANIRITIGQTLEKIENIKDESINADDKEKLKDYLYSLEGIKVTNDKNKFWEKSKEVLKFIADKGADIAVASLPYILSGLSWIHKNTITA